MKIILVRHGDADAEIPEGLDDDGRPLTTRSRLALPAHFAQLTERIGTPSIIYMSPLVRAVQTATILCQALSYEGQLRTSRALFPDGPIGALDGLLAAHEGDTVVLVGHQPSVGSAAAYFLKLASFPKPVQPGTVIGVDRGEGEGAEPKLLFYAAPGQPVVDNLPHE